MRLTAFKKRLGKTERDLVLLMLASLGAVIVLTVGLGLSGPGSGAPSDSGRLLPVALLAGAALMGAYAMYDFAGRSRQRVAAAEAEVRDLLQRLATAEALIRAEPQVLIYWEQGRPPRMVAETLTGIPGLPDAQSELLRFNMWLDQKSTDAIKNALDALFIDGTPFNLILRTEAGGHVEADGRAAGGRAVLRLRDVAGYKRDLSRIAERHAGFARDIQSSRSLLDALPVPVWLKNQDGSFAWVNTAYSRAVEAQSAEEVLERQIELLDSRQRKTIEATLAKDGGYKERLAIIIGGERRMHDVIVRAAGQMVAGAAIDVTALEKAERELDRQMTAYDRTLNRVATAVAIFGPDQHLSFYNEAYLKLWQLDAEWLDTSPSDGDILDRLRDLGRLPEVVHYRDWKKKLLACYTAGTPQEDRWNLPDGRFVRVFAEQRPDGGVTYLYSDETERYALESRYNALIGVQRETLDSLKEGVAVFGTDGRLQLFNAALAQIWRLSAPTLNAAPHIDAFIRDVRVLCEDPKTWSRIAYAVTSFTDKSEPLEGQMLRPDNSVIDYAATPLPDGGTLLTFADVTDSKRYERALIERNEALVAADAMKNKFIGNMSYELRTPLNTIIGFSEMLEQEFMGPLNDKQREYVGDIMSSSRTLLAIIDDILDLATIDAGGLELKLETVNVRDVIKASITGVREQVIAAGLTLDIAVEDNVREFMADQGRVRQVLYNLLSNAVGFSRVGGVVHISCWREDGSLVFAVEDHGTGIPKDQMAKVFDRFESRSHGSKHRGAGLGLSIAKNLVELHGGTIDLESEVGVGTRVTVRFPERGKAQTKLEAYRSDDTAMVSQRRQ